MGICFHSCRKLIYLVIRFSCAEPLQSSIFFFPSFNMGSHSSRTGNREDEILQGRHDMKANSLTWLPQSALRKKKKRTPASLGNTSFFSITGFLFLMQVQGVRGGQTPEFCLMYWSFLMDSLLLFSHFMSDSWQAHGLQHPRLPCPSLSPGVSPNSGPLSR